jgi:hypothetical protein
MHISLDSALGQQRRLNSVGESITQIAPDPAAAYSLRSLTGADPKVVRVRRSSNDAEQDFTASAVSSGELVDFVNEIQTLGTVTNSSGNNGFTLTNASSTGFTATTDTATGVCGWPYTAESGDKITVSFDAVIRSGTPQFLPRRATALSGDNLASVVSDSPLSVNSTGSYSFEFTYDDNQAGSLTFSEGDDNADFDISNFQVTVFKGAGLVETWYDQSGNGNNGTQTTASLQPKIVDAGSLITMNGKPAFEFTSSSSSPNFHLFNMTSEISGISDFSTFFVSEVVDRSGRGILVAKDSQNYLRMNDATFQFEASNTDSGAINFNSTLTDGGQFSLAFIRASNTLTAYVAGAAQSNTVSNSDNFAINKLLGRDVNFQTWINKAQELIFYTSDQTANVSTLNTNMASHYGIS